ncbi:hypothetical protein PBCV1_a309R [Paramecium bursaria Chlorella virus 1]|uniref:Uncharacterized protein n=1 Tax=Paramecium bursaria Chlorella virus 1 TaxID=10506 RepID=F8TU15_PBCV1|nr:hypothetical protein PBCV1_a309R [Paramecium bursaria Chlorella virus 1]AEI70076.1 hypothetical protein [Paramecium bursaria Chlorella virus 1]
MTHVEFISLIVLFYYDISLSLHTGKGRYDGRNHCYPLVFCVI